RARSPHRVACSAATRCESTRSETAVTASKGSILADTPKQFSSGQQSSGRLTLGEANPVPADPATIVIFGGAGDLAARKLLPALYNLHVDGLLPPRAAIVGVGRKALTDETYRAFARDGTERFSRRPPEDVTWQTFAQSIFFHNGSIEDPAGYRAL